PPPAWPRRELPSSSQLPKHDHQTIEDARRFLFFHYPGAFHRRILKYALGRERSQEFHLARDLSSQVLKGDHRAVAKAISIVEAGGEPSRKLIQELYPHTGRAYTIGVTGPTGTGKSTLVDKTIEEYRKRGCSVGVL